METDIKVKEESSTQNN